MAGLGGGQGGAGAIVGPFADFDFCAAVCILAASTWPGHGVDLLMNSAIESSRHQTALKGVFQADDVLQLSFRDRLARDRCLLHLITTRVNQSQTLERCWPIQTLP